MKGMIIAVCALSFCLYSFAQSPKILVPYRVGDKWGYSDTLGKIKIQPKYDSVPLFDYSTGSTHVIAIVTFKGKPMVINETGAVVVPSGYDLIQPLGLTTDPAFFIWKNGKLGVFRKGKELFPPIYDYMDVTSYLEYKVHRNGKWGLINGTGKIVIPVIYDDLREISNPQTGVVRWEGIDYATQKTKSYEVKKSPVVESSDLPPLAEALVTNDPIFSEKSLTNIMETAKKEYGLDSIHFKRNAGIAYKGTRQGIFLPRNEKNVYFFSKPYKIHDIKYVGGYDQSALNKRNAYVIAELNGTYGIVDEEGNEVLAFIYNDIEVVEDFFLLYKDKKVGFFVLNTIYPAIHPAYDKYLSKTYVRVNSRWIFTLFKVVKNGKRGFVGENGVAFFRD